MKQRDVPSKLSLRRFPGKRRRLSPATTAPAAQGRKFKILNRQASTAATDFRELLQLCPEAIWIQSRNLVVYANGAALTLFGAAAESDIIGMHWHRLVSPGCWDDAETHVAFPDAGAGPHIPQLEMNYLALDGSCIAADSASTLIRYDAHQAVMLVVHEITGRKRIEQELREHRARLEQLVLERTADLRQALADARLSDRAKDAFLANVSHELRTPLGGMIGLTELALNRCKDASLRDHLEKIARTGKHLSRIINDLLDLSKVVAGRMAIEEIPFSLREMLLRAQEVIAHKAEAKGLQLRFRADNDIPDALVGDAMRIEQILLNLVGNAIKFTHAGRVDMHISLATRSEDQVRLQIDVEDTGIGMTAEEISGLFQPFAQATAATSREYGGTGLGLALSQRLAEAMGGRITVRSQKGRGSIFSLGLRLPLADAPQAAIPAPVPAVIHADRSHARVLLVEDDPLNVEIVTELLQGFGVFPQLAENGHEAVVILSQEGPAAYDLVLMDVQMPVLDGHAATRMIRAWPGFAALPIVAMTAHVLEHERQASIAAGMNDFISKPFEATAFHAMLDKWLPWGAQAGAAAAGPPPAPEPTTRPAALPSLRCLDIAAAIERFAGNEERYRHWLGKFVADSPMVAPDVRRALAAGENEKAAGLVHSFKGHAGTLGLDALHARAAALEAAIRGGQAAVPELRQLERAIDEARREIISALGL